jgi:DNA-binding transcriptional ArsR family regulator
MVNNSFEALANPIRRSIVERLAAGPLTVGAATSGLSVSKPALSRHVRVLESAGLVERAVHGRTHQLTLNVTALDEARDWLDQQTAIWGRLLDAAQDQVRAASGRSSMSPSAPGTPTRNR